MLKSIAYFSLITTLIAGLSAYASPAPIPFGIDCMIHDAQGKMLSDLGMLGAMMGSYTDAASFNYQDLKIDADLKGPFAEAPEVASPQIKLTVLNDRGDILASLVTTASPNLNAALFIPSEDLYLHCDQMKM